MRSDTAASSMEVILNFAAINVKLSIDIKKRWRVIPAPVLNAVEHFPGMPLPFVRQN